MIRLRKSAEVVAYTYEAGEHCLDCHEQRFGVDAETATDSEGNFVYPVFLDQTDEPTFYCDTCRTQVTY